MRHGTFNSVSTPNLTGTYIYSIYTVYSILYYIILYEYYTLPMKPNLNSINSFTSDFKFWLMMFRVGIFFNHFLQLNNFISHKKI